MLSGYFWHANPKAMFGEGEKLMSGQDDRAGGLLLGLRYMGALKC